MKEMGNTRVMVSATLRNVRPGRALLAMVRPLGFSGLGRMPLEHSEQTSEMISPMALWK